MTAQKATGPDRANDRPRQDQTKHPEIVGEPTDQSKRAATLKAQFALKGHAVHALAEGGFLVCRWGLVRACRDLDELETFARQIGVIE